MITTVFFTIIGIPTGIVVSIFMNDIHKRLHRGVNISNTCKYSIVAIITFFSFLRGYTGNDLVKNIYELYNI